MKYFAYIRKSSDREDAQTLSKEAQKRELEKIIEHQSLDVVRFFSESKSAYKIGRPEFNKMLEGLENGEADGILTYHLTRIARNSFDGGRVIYMMDEGLIKEIRTGEKQYTNNSDDKFLMQIHFAMAKKSSDDTSQFVLRDIKSKILKGEYPSIAPIGYLNLDKYGRITGKRYDSEKQALIEKMLVEEGRNFRRVEQDPILASCIVNLFEEFATGRYSSSALAQLAFGNGVFGARSKSKLSVASVFRILTNPIYYGAIRWKEDIYEPDILPEETRHIPIISKTLFDKVQNTLSDKSRPRSQKHSYAYTGLIRCGECGCAITAETQKGKIYYRCTKKKGKCSQKYLRESLLEEQLEQLVLDKSMPKKFATWALGILKREEEENIQHQENSLKQLNRENISTEKQLSALIKLKISPDNQNNELLSNAEYLTEKNQLLVKKQAIKDKLANAEQNRSLWIEQCEEFFDFTTQLSDRWHTNSKEQRKQIVAFMFGSNVYLNNQKIEGDAQLPFVEVSKAGDLPKWRDRRDSNSQPHA